jgi:hypothetical protein
MSRFQASGGAAIAASAGVTLRCVDVDAGCVGAFAAGSTPTSHTLATPTGPHLIMCLVSPAILAVR